MNIISIHEHITCISLRQVNEIYAIQSQVWITTNQDVGKW